MPFSILFLLVFIPFKALGAGGVSPSYLKEALEFQNTSLKKSEALQQEKKFQKFYESLLQHQDRLMKDNNRSLQNKRNGCFLHACEEKKETDAEQDPLFPEPEKHLYIFVSFSLGEKALFNLAKEAKLYNAVLVLRGFVEGSYAKTVKILQKIIQETGQGFLIDPELFTLFSIQAIPTFVLSKPFPFSVQERIQTPLHDRIQGHVSAQYALEIFAKGGELKESAQALLKKGQGR